MTLAVLMCSSYFLAGCGGASPRMGTAPPTPVAPTTLTGNWLLSPQLPGAISIKSASLSANLVVSGSQISGIAYLQIPCGSSAFRASPFFLLGTIADNGSFTLTNIVSPSPFLAEKIFVSGTSPSLSSPNTWTGTYILSPMLNAPADANPCTFSQTAGFTAAPITAPSGNYTGTVANTTFPMIGSAGFSLHMSESSPILVPSSALGMTYMPIDYVPVTAELTVSGSSCFKSGTATTQSGFNYLGGDFFGLSLNMDDGSQLDMDGFLNDVNASSAGASFIVTGGTCNGAHGLMTLARS